KLHKFKHRVDHSSSPLVTYQPMQGLFLVKWPHLIQRLSCHYVGITAPAANMDKSVLCCLQLALQFDDPCLSFVAHGVFRSVEVTVNCSLRRAISSISKIGPTGEPHWVCAHLRRAFVSDTAFFAA